MPQDIAPATTQGMEILIVEDSPSMAMTISRVVKSLLDKFPGSRVGIVSTKVDAIASILRHAPDFMLLDAVLDDATAEEVMASMPFFDEHTPTLIVTGHQVSSIRAMLPETHKHIDIIDKRDFVDVKNRGWLFTLILNILVSWRTKKREMHDERIARNHARIEEIQRELNVTPK